MADRSDWLINYPELGREVVDQVQRLGFRSASRVLDSVRELVNQNPLMIGPLGLAFAHSTSKRVLVDRLRLLIAPSMERPHWGSGTKEIFAILLEAYEYGIDQGYPDEPGVARLVQDLISLFQELHALHEPPEGQYRMGSTPDEVIATLEYMLLERIGERTKPEKRYGQDSTFGELVLPSLEVQEQVLRFLLSFESRHGLKAHRDQDSPVRRKAQEVALASIRTFDEPMVTGLLDEFRSGGERDMIVRGLVQRFRPSEVLVDYLAHRRCPREDVA